MDKPFIAIWEFVQTAGPSGIFALMWWLERKRANELQKAKDTETREVITAMRDTANAMAGLKEVLSRGRRG